jgi:hypothetical protein
MSIWFRAIQFAALGIALASSAVAVACPFCDVASQTLTEETQAADAAVLARLVKEAASTAEPTDPNSGVATFEIVEVLRGQDALSGVKEIDVVYFGDADRERVFLITGLGAEKPDWTTPLPLSPAAVEYLRKLPGVPAAGAERLEFFQEYLEHEDPLLAQDAYDEFGRAPYEDVQALGPKMHHDQLVKWIADLQISPSRRRLYFTMLGVCGSKDDLPLLESMIASDFDAMEPYLQQLAGVGIAMAGPVGLPALIEIVKQDERGKKLGLDALVACYLVLRGAEGLDLIDERFLKNPAAEYTHVYSTIMALRFHGDQETGVLPRERLLASMRLLLDNADFADQVILDLSRWEDWSVMDRLVDLFKTSDNTGYVRQPVVTYLTVASEQPGDVGARAKSALDELERLDPETVKQARSLMAFGALGRARGNDTTVEAADAGAAAADPGQGFAASAADNRLDPAEIPDPATYAQSETTAAKPNDVAAAGTTKDMTDDKNSAATPAAQVAAVDPPAELDPVLVISIPLGAAALLMGVYWLILRAGAL